MVLSSTSLSTAAPTPMNVANRNASSTFSQVRGNTGFNPGRASSAMRIELFWKLALMPASLILRTSSS